MEAASDEVLELFRKIQKEQDASDSSSGEHSGKSAEEEGKPVVRIFLMSSLQQVMNVSAIIAKAYDGRSSLYKDQRSEGYLLLLAQDSASESFDKACNIASEYGVLQRSAAGSGAFYSEHYDTLIPANAVQALGGSLS